MTHTQLKQLSNQLVFNPRDKKNPYKIIIDMDDPIYTLRRAIECIGEALYTDTQGKFNSQELSQDKIKQAGSLLLLGWAQLNDNTTD